MWNVQVVENPRFEGKVRYAIALASVGTPIGLVVFVCTTEALSM